jgi:hypothetical protein
MAAMGAVGLGVYEAHPAPTRSFPIYNTDGGIAYPEFAYPVSPLKLEVPRDAYRICAASQEHYTHLACCSPGIHCSLRLLRVVSNQTAKPRITARYHHGPARITQ